MSAVFRSSATATEEPSPSMARTATVPTGLTPVRDATAPLWHDGVLSRSLFAAMAVMGLTLLAGMDFGAFHLVAEMATVIVSVLVFTVAAATYRFNRNNYLLYLGGSYLWVGALDFLHALTYQNTGLTTLHPANVSTQFWLAGRGMEACALLLAPLFLQRQKPMRMLDVVIGQGWMVVALAVGIFYDLFPRTYVEGVGLTAAKVVSEWVVVAILALASLHLHVKRRYISRNTRLLMMLAAVTAIAAEVLLTTYISLDGVVMLLGHLCKFLSYWLVFEALVHTTVVQPFDPVATNLQMLEAVPTPLFLLSSQGIVLYANPAGSQWMGLPADLLHGRLLSSLCTDAGGCHGLACPLVDAIRRGAPLRDFDLMAASCHRQAEADLVAIDWACDDGGRALMLTLRDISRTRQVEQDLKLTQQRLDMALAVEGQGLWDWDIRSGTTSYSREMLSFLGYSSADDALMARQNWQRLVHPEDLGKMMNALNDHLGGRSEIYNCEYRVRTRNNQWVWLRSLGRVIDYDDDGAPLRAIGTHRDITALKQHEAALEASSSDLRDFAYVASHDLKEPLRTISQFLGLLQRRYGDRLEAEGLEYLSFARSGAQRLTSMVDDLLDYSQVDRLRMVATPVQLSEVVGSVVKSLSATLDQTGAIVRSEGEMPLIQTDGSLLARVLQNLIGNGIKYRSAERIPEVIVRCRESGPYWAIEVSDNGIGIGVADCEQIFHIFRRLHTADHSEGNGIGLAIVKRIVERLQGSVSVHSVIGVGSTFTVLLPQAPASP